MDEGKSGADLPEQSGSGDGEDSGDMTGADHGGGSNVLAAVDVGGLNRGAGEEMEDGKEVQGGKGQGMGQAPEGMGGEGQSKEGEDEGKKERKARSAVAHVPHETRSRSVGKGFRVTADVEVAAGLVLAHAQRGLRPSRSSQAAGKLGVDRGSVGKVADVPLSPSGHRSAVAVTPRSSGTSSGRPSRSDGKEKTVVTGAGSGSGDGAAAKAGAAVEGREGAASVQQPPEMEKPSKQVVGGAETGRGVLEPVPSFKDRERQLEEEADRRGLEEELGRAEVGRDKWLARLKEAESQVEAAGVSLMRTTDTLATKRKAAEEALGVYKAWQKEEKAAQTALGEAERDVHLRVGMANKAKKESAALSSRVEVLREQLGKRSGESGAVGRRDAASSGAGTGAGGAEKVGVGEYEAQFRALKAEYPWLTTEELIRKGKEAAESREMACFVKAMQADEAARKRAKEVAAAAPPGPFRGKAASTQGYPARDDDRRMGPRGGDGRVCGYGDMALESPRSESWQGLWGSGGSRRQGVGDNEGRVGARRGGRGNGGRRRHQQMPPPRGFGGGGGSGTLQVGRGAAGGAGGPYSYGGGYGWVPDGGPPPFQCFQGGPPQGMFPPGDGRQGGWRRLGVGRWRTLLMIWPSFGNGWLGWKGRDVSRVKFRRRCRMRRQFSHGPTPQGAQARRRERR